MVDMKKVVVLIAVLMVMSLSSEVFSQCAMCRTQIENNVSNGDMSLAAGLNTGIMYLFFTPYIAIATLIFLWFRNSKVNEGKKSLASRFGSKVP